MSYEKDRLKDYIQVNERILRFYEKFPDGSLQSEIIALEKDRVVMKGYAYRMPNDARPGIGYSSLQIPGPTPYTKFSEIENAETSAWGRALAALGFEVKRGIASRDEIENKANDGARPRETVDYRTGEVTHPDADLDAAFQASTDTPIRADHVVAIKMWCQDHSVDFIEKFGPAFGVESIEALTEPQYENWLQHRNRVLPRQETPAAPPPQDGPAPQVLPRPTSQTRTKKGGDPISPARAKRMYAISKGNGALIDEVIGEWGYDDSRTVGWKDYDDICRVIEERVNEAA